MTLPVRELVLYKHGVGFFIRQGAIEANEITLAFRQDEINDVLKSLTVIDQTGGQVLGIHYQTPMDKAARLANSSIHLSENASLRDLIRDLRGRHVTFTYEITVGSIETVTGRVIGIDQIRKELANPIISISVLTDQGQGRVFDLTALRSFQILDTQSEHDMAYFLDTSMSEDTRRTVAVRLSEGSHDLLVSYVAPSPTWRVSYRIVAESDESCETGKALLQGWGLFDNRLEEDLDNVKVTLVAGQPISFVYDLYASRIPLRPTVRDEARIAPGPIEYDAATDTLGDMEPVDWLKSAAEYQGTNPEGLMSGGAMAKSGLVEQERRSPRFRKEVAARSAPQSAQTKESGEFFQYIVTTPVSVKRGESALVPIIGVEVPYQRELLYNGAKLPNHPVVAMRFNNTSELTLERGPVTVVEDNDYKGEAVVPFTKSGSEVYLAYAVELGIRITEQYEGSSETAKLSFDHQYLVYDEYNNNIVTYVIENTTTKPVVVTIEAPIPEYAELYNTQKPDVETATDYRWRINVPAKTRTEFKRQQRRLSQRRQELLSLKFQNLMDFLEHRWLDRSTFDQLAEILQIEESIKQAQEEQKVLVNTGKALYEKQQQLRANLSTLNPAGQEANFRNRILAQLEASQDELDALEKRSKELNLQIAQNTEKLAQLLAALGKSENSN